MKELITYPLNDVDYSAEDAGLFHCTRKSGVWHQDSFPIEVSGADNTIFIGKGLAWFSNTEFWGKVAAQKTKVSLDLEYADTVYDRIDVIALQFDASKNATNLIVKKGEAKTNPTIPSISRTEAVYELYLYAITRPASSLTVTSENVRDLRLDDAYCGLMADSVTSLDFPIVPVEKGGTGKYFLTPNSVLVGNGSENVKNIPSKTGALYVDGNQTEPKFDILPVSAGGTGADHHTINSVLVGDAGSPVKHVSTSNGALYATGANSAPKFGTLPIAQGGTGAKSIADARNNLGLGNTDGALPIANGGTGATTASGARNALGLGNTTGALPVANGGTGATTVAAARNNLGLGNTDGALPIANGGTGAKTTSAARANLGLGSVATESILPIAKGGTGATSASDAREKLGAMGNSGNQELTNASFRVIDENGAGNGLAVRRKKDGVYHSATIRGGTNGGALYGYNVVDAKGNSTQKNYLIMEEDATSFLKPLNIAGGGTGGTTKTEALNNLGISLNSVKFAGSAVVDSMTNEVSSSRCYVLKLLGYQIVFVNMIVKLSAKATVSSGKWYAIATYLDGAASPSIDTALAAADNNSNARMVAAQITSDGDVKIKFNADLEKGSTYFFRITGAYVVNV